MSFLNGLVALSTWCPRLVHLSHPPCHISFVFQAVRSPGGADHIFSAHSPTRGHLCPFPLLAIVPNAAMDAGGVVVRHRTHTRGALVTELATGKSWTGRGTPGLRKCGKATSAGAPGRVPRGRRRARQASGQPAREDGAWGSDQILSRRGRPREVSGGSGVWLTSQRTPLVAGGRTAREWEGGGRPESLSGSSIPGTSPTPRPSDHASLVPSLFCDFHVLTSLLVHPSVPMGSDLKPTGGHVQATQGGAFSPHSLTSPSVTRPSCMSEILLAPVVCQAPHSGSRQPRKREYIFTVLTEIKVK